MNFGGPQDSNDTYSHAYGGIARSLCAGTSAADAAGDFPGMHICHVADHQQYTHEQQRSIDGNKVDGTALPAEGYQPDSRHLQVQHSKSTQQSRPIAGVRTPGSLHAHERHAPGRFGVPATAGDAADSGANASAATGTGAASPACDVRVLEHANESMGC